jgi:acetyl esterase
VTQPSDALDPQLQAILDGMSAQPEPAEPPTLDETRAAVSAMTVELSPPATDMASITEIDVAGPNGAVRCIVNRPTDAERLPVFLYFHGGGCVLLGADECNPVCTNIASQAGCIVVNVDYRLAPEHPFPAPLDDAFAAYRWCLEHADEVGGDPSRVAIGGDSAGGYLAAAITLEAKAAGLAQPTLQVLIYPQVDMADRSASMIEIDAFINEPMLAGLVAAHVGDAVLDPRASPLRAADHGGLAPAFILAAGHDPLVDQGRAYAALLRRSGVETEYRCYDGAIHAFFTFGAAVDIANDAVAEVAQQLSAAFAD